MLEVLEAMGKERKGSKEGKGEQGRERKGGGTSPPSNQNPLQIFSSHFK